MGFPPFFLLLAFLEPRQRTVCMIWMQVFSLRKPFHHTETCSSPHTAYHPRRPMTNKPMTGLPGWEGGLCKSRVALNIATSKSKPSRNCLFKNQISSGRDPPLSAIHLHNLVVQSSPQREAHNGKALFCPISFLCSLALTGDETFDDCGHSPYSRRKRFTIIFKRPSSEKTPGSKKISQFVLWDRNMPFRVSH